MADQALPEETAAPQAAATAEETPPGETAPVNVDFSDAFDVGRVSEPTLEPTPTTVPEPLNTEPEPKTSDDPGPSTSSGATIPQDVFQVKQIETPHDKLNIILQSVNGPCPLIAIMNCLLLQRRIALPADNEFITATSLCSLLGNYLLDRAQQNTEETQHTEQYILDSLDRFVQIQTGIDINVKFNSVDGFEYTPELSLFDLARVRVLHGWVVDPQDNILSDLVGDLSYNQLVEKTMTKSCSVDTREVSESLLMKDLLESSQLTVHGICEINTTLNTGDIAVLFRNNHFSTITKQNGMLFVLVTDIGWAEQVNVVWETLDSTCNRLILSCSFAKLFLILTW